MTSSEQQALSERVATLAEAAGLPKELLWEPAETCPQGHKIVDGRVGEICYSCRPNWKIVPDSYWVAAKECRELDWMPDWHPEWRIGRVAKDFRDPMSLLAVVEVWRTQRPMRSWSVDSQVDYASPDTPTLPYATIGNGHCEYFETDGETPWEALALAFVEALEREKGAAE